MTGSEPLCDRTTRSAPKLEDRRARIEAVLQLRDVPVPQRWIDLVGPSIPPSSQPVAPAHDHAHRIRIVVPHRMVPILPLSYRRASPPTPLDE